MGQSVLTSLEALLGLFQGELGRTFLQQSGHLQLRISKCTGIGLVVILVVVLIIVVAKILKTGGDVIRHAEGMCMYACMCVHVHNPRPSLKLACST